MLLLHLDGVGRAQLEHALEHGYAPTLRAMLERGPYRLSPCRSGAPTSTPAFQAGLLYGVGHDIPGYTWFDKRRGSEVRMDRGADPRLLAEGAACGIAPARAEVPLPSRADGVPVRGVRRELVRHRYRSRHSHHLRLLHRIRRVRAPPGAVLADGPAQALGAGPDAGAHLR